MDSRHSTATLDRILNRSPRSEPEVEASDVRNAFDEVRAPRTRGREGIMLDVRKANGQSHAMSYAYLIRVDFEPGDRLRLHFAADVILVEGRRLGGLYRRLIEHRVDAIQEGTEAEDGLKPEDAAHIDRLDLISNAEARHDHH